MSPLLIIGPYFIIDERNPHGKILAPSHVKIDSNRNTGESLLYCSQRFFGHDVEVTWEFSLHYPIFLFINEQSHTYHFTDEEYINQRESI